MGFWVKQEIQASKLSLKETGKAFMVTLLA
jgi:hypothetical protein